MQFVRINSKLSISGQPALGDFSCLAMDGFTSVINNRPDGEASDQPGSAAEEQAANAAGLVYVHIPVKGCGVNREAVLRFQEALASAPGPVLAHCKSGKRAIALYVLAEALSGRMAVEAIRPFGERLGFDLEFAADWLDEQNVESIG